MSWDFEADEEYAAQLELVENFVKEEIEPIDLILGHPANIHDPLRNKLLIPLQERVKAIGLWAAHLPRELGGQGYGQVKLALLNEILGRSRCAPVVFGCQAPDSGNSEILAKFGSVSQKKKYLTPLLAGDIVSCFSMTEPAGGSDPTSFVTSATFDGGQWILNGEKWFSSNARYAEFLIVMAVTEPDAPRHQRMSMLIVPASTPGLSFIRNSATAGQPFRDGSHGHIRFDELRLPSEALLGTRGAAFRIAQERLGGGRIHHAMRCVGLVRSALDAMCQRAVSRTSGRGRLAERQFVQQAIADSWIELEQFRLLVLQTAWKIDKFDDYQRVQGDISAVKAVMPKVLHDVAARALHMHGSLGTTDELPFARYVMESFQMALADGPTEIHKASLAKRLLEDYEPSSDTFPNYYLPTAEARAAQRYTGILTDHPENKAWT